MLVKCIKN